MKLEIKKGVIKNLDELEKLYDDLNNNMPVIKLYEKTGYKYLDSIDLELVMYGLDWFKIYEKVI